MQALRAGDAKALGKSLSNDLQPAACSLRPALRLVLDVGLDYGALGGIVLLLSLMLYANGNDVYRIFFK